MPRHERARRLQALQTIFGLQGFRPGQEKAVDALLRGRDLICILPTGAGKSLCWQLPAVLHEGWTLVVSPLIALMRDQLRGLEKHGLEAVCLDSLQTEEERDASLARLASGQARIALVSPERLQSARFRRVVQARPPWLMVVDEAHCLPRWGESFRPAYAQLDQFLAALPARPVLCAMTATADAAMRRDIARSLGMRRPRQVVLPVTRENLRMALHTTIRPEETILLLMEEHAGEKRVIFCRTRRETERLAMLLRGEGMAAEHYHAGMAREERLAAQTRFTQGETEVLAATTAFGMGVDVPDIRCIVVNGLPETMLDLAQQFGRAGRDGKSADCVLLLDPAALEIRRKHLVRSRRESWKTWRRAARETGALLDWCLSGRCLQQGIAQAFGQRCAPCGVCSACERAQRLGGFRRLAPVPEIHRMRERHLRAWALRWERAEIARRDGVGRQAVMQEQALRRAAEIGRIPSGTRMREEYRRPMAALLKHMTGREE
ncbi:MAG: RecQ family ATP-dependent DNA helicase [Aristaeellaceae bacterium]